jgi:hypothetical protein
VDPHGRRISAPRPTFLVEMSLVQGMMVSPAAIAANVDLRIRAVGAMAVGRGRFASWRP